jgi:8-oxo-dGTP diphosphatase
LLTNHSKRGLEFPGGKLEGNEVPEEAAVREVFEETGGEVSSLTYIGQYKVVSKGKTIIKNIYFATIGNVIKKEDYMETDGPVMIDELPSGIQQDDAYSFIMKDNVLQYVMKYVKRTFL